MGFTILNTGTEVLSDSPDLRQAVEGFYAEPRRSSSPDVEDAVQFLYENLSPKELKTLLGQVADANDPVGVFVDADPIEVDGAYIFSVPRIVARMRETASPLSPTANELTEVLSSMVKNPKAAYPIVLIRW